MASAGRGGCDGNLELDRAESPNAATDMLERFEDVATMLARYPEAGIERSSLAEGLRSFTVAGYVLFYRPSRSGIDIVRIIHSRRDITLDLF